MGRREIENDQMPAKLQQFYCGKENKALKIKKQRKERNETG